MKKEIKNEFESREEIRNRKGGSMRHFVAKDELGNIQTVFLDPKINPKPTEYIVVGAGSINKKHGLEILNSKTYFDLVLKFENKKHLEVGEYRAINMITDKDKFFAFVKKGYDLNKISMIIEIKKKPKAPQLIKRK